MTDNEETRSYSEILAANEELTLANERLTQAVETLKAAGRKRSQVHHTEDYNTCDECGTIVIASSDAICGECKAQQQQ